jgi:1,2-phenylacetyl-CoA epoxidase catalytic subunit
MFTPENEYYDRELEELILKSHNGQWSVDTRIDWSQAPVVPEGMSSALYADMVSQLYYAEEAALQLCARLIRELPELQAKLYVCAQAADEARHAQAYRMYAERLGGLAPITADMKAIFEDGLAWDGPAWGLVAAMNIVLEREALAQQKRRIKQLPCPLFRAINQAIIVDESRHCRFGYLYLKNVVPHASAAERAAVLGWLTALWKRWCNSHVHRYTIAGAEVLHLRQDELAHSWRARLRLFDKLGLSAREAA